MKKFVIKNDKKKCLDEHKLEIKKIAFKKSSFKKEHAVFEMIGKASSYFGDLI